MNCILKEKDQKRVIKKEEKKIIKDLLCKGWNVGMIEDLGKELSKLSTLSYESFMDKVGRFL